MKYHSANPENTIGAEIGNRYTARTRRGGAGRRAPPANPGEPSRKPRDAAELLAKIDALYQELSLQPMPKTHMGKGATAQQNPRSVGLIFIGILIVVLSAGEVWLYMDRRATAKPSPPPVLVAETEVSREPALPTLPPPPEPQPVAAEPAPAVSTPPAEALATVDEAKARLAARRRAAAARKAKREAARRAAEAEAEAQAQAQARREAAKRAEMLAAAQAAAPRRPASPEALCAGESNFFSRNSCELRACQQPEWTKHPSCIRRRELLKSATTGG